MSLPEPMAPVSTTSVASIREHIAGRFASRAVEPFPSPHLIVSDFFPADVYRQILAFNPFADNRGKEWITSSEMKKRRQSTPYDHRKQVDLRGDFAATPEAHAFWKLLVDALLGDDWLARQMYKLYPAYFELRFGEAMLDPAFWTRLRNTMFVQRHEPGYHIGPHTDTPHRVFTCIFAFADQLGYEQLGTQFVRPRDPDVRCWGDLHHDHKDFEVATVAEYVPNNFVVFFKTRQSFHAVGQIGREAPNQRYGMQLAYYEPHDGLLRDLSRPDLMQDRTQKPLLQLRVFGRTLQIQRG